jgi:hypothetical protein
MRLPLSFIRAVPQSWRSRLVALGWAHETSGTTLLFAGLVDM